MAREPGSVLVVDDEQDIRQIIKAALEEDAHQVTTCADAESALEALSTGDFDLALVDINLPGMSGFDALQALRSDPATAHIPVIAVSANAMQRDIELGMKAGFFRYITKPIKVGPFLEAVNMALEFADRRSVSGK